MQGIYAIKCLVNWKIYIGSSVNIKNRWNGHKNLLNKGTHGNIILQRAWNKYSKHSFEFSIIEKTTDLIPREQFYIDYYQSFKRKYGYNISRIAGSSESKSKYWIVTRPNGEEVEVYNIHNFCRQENSSLDASCMIKVAKGNRNQHKGYKCRPATFSFSDWEKTRTRHWKGCAGWNGRWIIKWPNEKEEIVNALPMFCKNNNLSRSAMNSLANGIGWHHKGFKCIRDDGESQFKETPKKQYLVIYPDGKEIIIENLSEFSRKNNLIVKSMHQICGKTWDHKGYKCRKL